MNYSVAKCKGLPECGFRQARRLAAPLLLLLSPMCHAQNAGTQTVRVLQTNIHRDIGGSDSLTTSQPYLAKEVNYLDPDVWTMEELGGNNVSYNAATALSDLETFIHQDVTIFGANPQAGVNYFVDLSTINDGYDTTAIVSRYPFLGTQTYSDAGSYGSTSFSAERGLNMANIAVPGTAGLAVFTAHLKADGTTSDAEERQIQADTDKGSIAAWISSHSGEGVIVTGDFNDSEDAGDPVNWSGGKVGGTLTDGETYHPITTMKAAGLTDPRPVSILGNSNTISSAETSSDPLDSRFDYTLYNPNTVSFVSGQVFDTEQLASAGLLPAGFLSTDSANASDHLPVFSVFQIAAAPEPEVVTALLLGALSLGGLCLRGRFSAHR